MKQLLARLLCVASCLLAANTLSAAVETFEFSSEQLRDRYEQLVAELRCPKCQNQNLAGSDSPISSDLRREIYLMLEEGRSDSEITDFLVARYGVFILYDPPVSGVTLWLWLVPIAFALFGIALFVQAVRSASGRPIPAEEEEV